MFFLKLVSQVTVSFDRRDACSLESSLSDAIKIQDEYQELVKRGTPGFQTWPTSRFCSLGQCSGCFGLAKRPSRRRSKVPF